MTPEQLQIQDELCFDALTDETKALIYYGLHCLVLDIDRANQYATTLDNTNRVPLFDEKALQFRDNIRTAALSRIKYIDKTTPIGVSLIRHFAPEQ